MALMNGRYLAPSPYIDLDDPLVMSKAKELSKGLDNDDKISERCFQFVRDEILHSGDHRMGPVTLKASDVLKHGTGFCYAKSHLLAALLRANGIPASLCYQRLAIDDLGTRFCLHGLNAIYLEEYGWYRADARGNTDRVHANFHPPEEELAFIPRLNGEADMPGIWEEPLPAVVNALSRHTEYRDVLDDLPDVEVIAGKWSCGGTAKD